MIPLRPYLLRAIYEWTIDNGYTPHILVDANISGVKVPPASIRDGRITLNIHPNAVHKLELKNDWVLFSARFSGQSFTVEVPAEAVLAIFAKENGRGIFFQEESPDTPLPPDGQPPATNQPKKKGPALKIVK
jgi:stringent starvation protein B